MPQAPRKPCRQPGCPALVARGRFCPAHQKTNRRPDKRPSARKRGYDTRWDKARAGFLRKHPDCAYCGKAATVVDHIEPHRGDLDRFWARDNWQPLCASCHSSVKQRQESRNWRRYKPAAVEVTAVCGSPGAGKSTYVAKHRGQDDLLIDIDRLFLAATGTMRFKRDIFIPFVAAARDAMIERLARRSEVAHAWIVRGGAKADERRELAEQLGATVIVLETPPEECERRILADPERLPAREVPLVAEWWRDYERREADTVIVWG